MVFFTTERTEDFWYTESDFLVQPLLYALCDLCS